MTDIVLMFIGAALLLLLSVVAVVEQGVDGIGMFFVLAVGAAGFVAMAVGELRNRPRGGPARERRGFEVLPPKDEDR